MVYDFEKVEPFAVAQDTTIVNVVAKLSKPNLFLMVDTSGSMNYGVSAPGCNCPTGMCPASCPTRWTELRSAMQQFLNTSGGNVHLGLSLFPTDNRCTNPGLTDISSRGVPLDQSPDESDALQATANQVRMRIEAVVPTGGTPTNASLRPLVDYPPLQDKSRPNFVLLLTDGLPNCNAALDSQAATCECTSPKTPGMPCPTSGGNQCLDDTGAEASVLALKDKGIRTIVVGFGADVAGAGGPTLQKLALAGGFERPCIRDADCGSGDLCNVSTVDNCGRPARVCAKRFFQAGNANELANALDKIRESIRCNEPCRYKLRTKPSDPAFIAVRVDELAVPRSSDTWRYDEPNTTVEFVGALCTKLTNSTSADPVKLEIRVVETY